MRFKIIAVNALIVAVVGLFSYWLVRVSTASAPPEQQIAEAKHDVHGAAARLQLDAIRTERWLASKASESATINALTKASPTAKADSATERCNQIVNDATPSPLFHGNLPSLVALVDRSGRILGRNGTELGRGENLANALQKTLDSGNAGSDVWVEKERFLVSYVAVRDPNGNTLGGIVLGRPLNDVLSRVSDATTGRPLALVVPGQAGLDVVGHAGSLTFQAAVRGDAKGSVTSALSTGRTDVVAFPDAFLATTLLDALGDGKHAALIALAPKHPVEHPGATAILYAVALGLVLSVIAGWQLGNYIFRPINQLEEGLLAVLNGHTDRTFDSSHPELGGLAFRIGQLVDELTGVEQDTSDAEGRVSLPSADAHFSGALAVDAGQPEPLEAEDVARLAAEPAVDYYPRLYNEYIEAKQTLGEPVAHITEIAFRNRIQGMEAEALAKGGRPVRYRVVARERDIVLVAVPLYE